MPKEFKASKELQAFYDLLKTFVNPVTQVPSVKAYFDNDTGMYVDLSVQLTNIYDTARQIEEDHYNEGKKDTTHLPFIRKSTQLLQRIKESAQPGKDFTPKEVEKIAASFESEYHVNKKLRIAGAVVLGMLVVAALAAIAVATFGLATTPFIGAGFTAFSAFMAAAGAKMLATLTAITGSALGISIVTGSAATFGFTSVIAGLGAKIAGDAKQKRLDNLHFSIFGQNVNTLFASMKSIQAAPVPDANLAPTLQGQ